MHQKLVPDTFLILVHNPKQAIACKEFFYKSDIWKQDYLKALKRLTFFLSDSMSSVCYSYVLVCHSRVTPMYSYIICMSLVCTGMSSVCHSYVIHMSLVCTRMSSVCHSYVLVCHSYVTRLWFYHERYAIVLTHLSNILYIL